MVGRHRILIAALLSAGAALSTAGAADLGKNLAGEICRSAGPLAADQATAITCGASQEAIGSAIFAPAPPDRAQTRSELTQLVQSQSDGLDCGEEIGRAHV